MGRRLHLEKTLPSWLQSGASQVLVVDYACPDDIAGWVEGQDDLRVRAVRVTGDTTFNRSRALNYGLWHVQDPWVLILDADTLIRSPSFFEALREEPGTAAVALPSTNPDLTGALFVEKATVERLGGFDEGMIGWGGEDIDMRVRLHLAGVRMVPLPPGLAAIPHGDELRVAHHTEKDRRRSNDANMARLRAKLGPEADEIFRRPEVQALLVDY